MTEENIWPEDIADSEVTPPIKILKTQASKLSKLTNDSLNAEVKTKQTVGEFKHILRVIAPALDNYMVELLQVRHDIKLYPCKLTDLIEGRLEYSEIKGPDQLLDSLKEIMKNEIMVKTLRGLISQVKDEEEDF